MPSTPESPELVETLDPTRVMNISELSPSQKLPCELESASARRAHAAGSCTATLRQRFVLRATTTSA
jgi:hypothetical protein